MLEWDGARRIATSIANRASPAGLVVNVRVGDLERYEDQPARGPQVAFLKAEARAPRQGFPRAGTLLSANKKAARRRSLSLIRQVELVGSRLNATA